MINRTIAAVALAAASICLAVPASAYDIPKRKQGLWEFSNQMDGRGAMTMQLCVDATNEDVTAQQAEARKRCSKIDVRRLGNRVEIDSVCQIENTTATSIAVITGDLSSQYRMEQTTNFSPPMYGMSKSHSVMTGKWIGPCKPGQKNGSMTIQGMPAGANMKITPEMMEQMRKMQEKYGR